MIFASSKTNTSAYSLVVLMITFILPIVSMADSLNYTAGATCVGRTPGQDRLLTRSKNRVFNKSTSKYAQVYCSGPSVEIPNKTSVRFIVYGRQGSTDLNFKGAFGIYRPENGAQLDSKLVLAPSTPNKNVKFGPADLLKSARCCAYNTVQLWIPPQSYVYAVYTAYDDQQSTPREAYVWANQQSSASYTPSSAHSYNSTNSPNTITRSGLGRYRVTLGGVRVNYTSAVAGKGGNVQVTAHNAPGASCQVQRWTGSPDLNVFVACYDASGSATDARFTLSYRALR